MINVIKEKMKFIVPVIIIIVVAVAVFFGMRFRNGEVPEELVELSAEEVPEEEEVGIQVPEEDIPMQENTNGAMYTLIATYYNAYATGDVETLKSITNYFDETDEIKIPQMSEYIEQYPTLQVYTKPGPLEGSYLTYVYYQMGMYGFEDLVSGMETFYVCTDENGNLYMNEGEVTEEEFEYIKAVNMQDDVVELSNRVNVECNDTFVSNPDLYYYIQEVVNDVQKTTGEILAQQNASETVMPQAPVEGETTGEQTPETTPDTPTPTGSVYATATTTVNVRSSDSEIADKVTKVSGGTKVEVLEQKVNGWSKVRVNNKEGYIKSEYLRMADAVTGTAIGTVTAKETVNVRMAAGTDSEKLGVLAGGASADLLEQVNDWCKINYNGAVGYVKTEFVTIQN